MKKYTKPYILVESFQLDAAIAGPCAEKNGGNGIAINHGLNNCKLVDAAGDIIFGAACVGGDIVDDDNEGACYQIMTNNNLSGLVIGS